MRTGLAICLTCPEITTGVHDSSKGFLLDASSNHHHCEVQPLGNPGELPAPIRNMILRLGASVPLTNNHIVMGALGFALEDQWHLSPSTAPAVESTSTTSPAPALASGASTRSLLASRPTSPTPAPGEQLGLDFDGGAA